jgi:hypothetical protein
MGLFRRQPVDDVDVESCLENLDRVDDFVGQDLARLIDLRGADERAAARRGELVAARTSR